MTCTCLCVFGQKLEILLPTLNQCAQGFLEGKTLDKDFTSEKPQVSHFHVLGCPIYLHILNEKRTNAKPSSNKGTVVGYNDTSKGYHIYILA